MLAAEAATLAAMSARAAHVCPICAREVAPRNGTPKNPSFPFCSPACKVVDLGRWFDGTYRIPEPADLEAGIAPKPASPDDDGGSEHEAEYGDESLREEDS
jgi:endogenous inhibitor of DNA gyrase (YacG/DUF329 family)